MTFFVVHALDAQGMAQMRAENRSAHRARLRSHEHLLKVHVGGPILNEDGEMCGTMLVVEADTRSEVENYLEGDPYVTAGVYASISIHPYLWGLGQPESNNG